MTVQDSVIYNWLLYLWQCLRRGWEASGIQAWCSHFDRWFRAVGQDSAFFRWATREGALWRGWKDSWLARMTTWVVNIPVNIVKAIYRWIRSLWDGSALLRGVSGVGRAGGVLLGLLAMVMLVAPHGMWNNIYAFLLATVIFGLYVISCADRDRELEVGRLGPYFAFYLIFITVGLLGSLDRSLSLRFYLFHLTCFFIALVAVSAVERYDQLRVMLALALVGLMVAALYGCYQGVVGVAVVAAQQDLILNAGMPGRIYSFFDNPNNFAEVLVMLVPLAGALTLNAKSIRGKLCGIGILAASLVAIGMTYSRSSWIGLVLAVGVFLTLMDWRFVPVAVALGACAIPFLPASIWNRILTIGNMKDTSARYRVAIYEAAGRLLRDHGLTGVGLGSDVTRAVFRKYPSLFDGNYPIHTHNNYLQMWSEVGICGLLAFLGLVLGQFKEGVRAFRQADKELKRIIAAALGAMGGILVVGLVEYTWFYPRNMFIFWFLFGVIAAAVKLAGKEKA